MGAPSFPKSSPALVERYEAALASHPETVGRSMFGYPASFIGGNMATGLCRDDWYVRLPPDEREVLLGIPGAGPFAPMPGRPMREYVVLPPSIVADDAALHGWLRRAIAYGASLPSKDVARPRAKTSP